MYSVKRNIYFFGSNNYGKELLTKVGNKKVIDVVNTQYGFAALLEDSTAVATAGIQAYQLQAKMALNQFMAYQM